MVDCCDPHQAYAPSGLQWRHARDCSLDPFGFIRYVDAPTPHTPAYLARKHRLQTLATGLDLRQQHGAPTPTIHPACKAAIADGSEPCSLCAWRIGLDTEGALYVEAHLEDETG